jgi:NTE family protein
MMEKCLAFVLGGGGARGAMQLGALRALFEAGYKPDLLVGTSIGAANATGLALWGVNLDGVAALERVYQTITEGRLMDSPGQLVWHALSRRLNYTSTRAREFIISAGITPDMRFNQFPNVRLGLIGANMNSGQPVIYGMDPGQSVLEGVLASCAVPPWFAPIENDDQFIVDGGALSKLPIEPALAMGATEIIALYLSDSSSLPGSLRKFDQLEKSISAFTKREIYLETALAEAHGVPVHFIELKTNPPIPIWEFRKHRELIEIGYDIACHEIASWPKSVLSPLRGRISNWFGISMDRR